MSSSATTERDQDWIRRTIPAGMDARIVDVTSSYAVYGVMGPRSRELLSRLTGDDLSEEAFGFGTSREIDLAHATVRATRITYVGELGWELYVPTEFALGVYDELMAAGQDLGVRNAGYYAIEALRLEKGFRAFGRELTPDFNPVEAGLVFACKLKTDIDFLGRAAVEKVRAEGPGRRLISFVCEDPDAVPWGGELLRRDGVAAGQVTSAAWGETVGAAVGLAYVKAPDGQTASADYVRSGQYEIDVGGQLVPVRVALKAPLDPTREGPS